jgi:hypothetical protein
MLTDKADRVEDASLNLVGAHPTALSWATEFHAYSYHSWIPSVF